MGYGHTFYQVKQVKSRRIVACGGKGKVKKRSPVLAWGLPAKQE